jgi:hypothetical protein
MGWVASACDGHRELNKSHPRIDLTIISSGIRSVCNCGNRAHSARLDASLHIVNWIDKAASKPLEDVCFRDKPDM